MCFCLKQAFNPCQKSYICKAFGCVWHIAFTRFWKNQNCVFTMPKGRAMGRAISGSGQGVNGSPRGRKWPRMQRAIIYSTAQNYILVQDNPAKNNNFLTYIFFYIRLSLFKTRIGTCDVTGRRETRGERSGKREEKRGRGWE